MMTLRIGMLASAFMVSNICSAQSSGPNRFRIVQDNKVGYIDAAGKIVIPPIYYNGSNFSDGMAAVRKDGLYGYIDTSGNFVIPPRYYKATAISEGLGQGFRKDHRIFINSRGEELGGHYKSMVFMSPGKRIVKTEGGHLGLMDMRTQRLVIDTAYTYFDRSGAYSIVATKSEHKKEQTGTLDTNGKVIIPFGKYRFIEPFEDGYSWAVSVQQTVKNEHTTTYVLIDEAGKEYCNRPPGYYNSRISDGLFRMRLDNPDSFGDNYDYAYRELFYDLKGNCVYNDTGCHNATDFSAGRVFISKHKNEWQLVDRSFKVLLNDTFDNVYTNFKDGYMAVRKEGKEGILDTNGKYLLQPAYDKLDISMIGSGYYFFSVRDASPNDDNYDESQRIHWGLADRSGRRVIEPILSSYDEEGFKGGLLRTEVNNRLTYFDRNGNIVWQEQVRPATNLQPLNVDVMGRGSCYARALRPFYTGHNGGGYPVYPRPLEGSGFKRDALTAVIDPTRADTLFDAIAGLPLTLANATKDTILFSAQDGRLYIKLQAQDSAGKWQDIEYLPSSWCGNSYHTLSLPPAYAWTFTIPHFEGALKTRIRAQVQVEMKFGKKGRKQPPVYIYSNEIEASVNPGQFYFKRGYEPAGLMDPYFE